MSELKLYNELDQIVEYWTKAILKEKEGGIGSAAWIGDFISEPPATPVIKWDCLDDAEAKFIRGALNSFLHSVLVLLDGGTQASDDGQEFVLTDASGSLISESLHEGYFEFLLESKDN